MFAKRANGGLNLTPKPIEKPQDLHFSQISVETAFDNCAKNCPKFSIEDFPYLCRGKERSLFVSARCKHMRDCKSMAEHLAKQVGDNECIEK